MGFVLRRAAFTVAGSTRQAVAEVMDAHLEMVSMIFLTTMWAVGYGWVEGVVGIGQLLSKVSMQFQFGRFSAYHLVLGLTIFAISFSFGFLKFTRMLYFRKRYMLFTALGNYPYGMVAQDFSYFFFAPYDTGLNNGTAWTCQGLGLGCWIINNPWNHALPVVIPRWYIVALSLSALFFFLAYRSALVNLLVTRNIIKQVGFLEKTRLDLPDAVPTEPVKSENASIMPKHSQVSSAPRAIAPPQVGLARKEELQVTQIVDKDREELIRKLRERFERGYS